MKAISVSVAILFASLPLNLGLTHEAAPGQAADESPRVFILEPVALKNLRAHIAAGQVHEPALDHLRSDADKAMNEPLLSVTEKQLAPPSGDKHDYMSLAPYWWPDPSKADGLPYIRRDGETNPEIQRVPDHKNFDKLMASAHSLALSYYLFREGPYAARATALLRAWFLDPATRMNPNLQFAQAVLGRNEGRGTGLIETRAIGTVVDSVGLLQGSSAWTAADQEGMHHWCARFLKWMLESANGKDEAAAKNNHGTYYDVQVISLALFAGNRKVAEAALKTVPATRIASQIEPDGSQPLEMARTKSLSYSTFNLAAFFELARLGENAGVNLWSFQTQDGRSIRKALDFLVPYVTGERQWPSEQIEKYNSAEIIPVLLTAADRFHSLSYRKAALRMDSAVDRSLEALLLASKNPN